MRLILQALLLSSTSVLTTHCLENWGYGCCEEEGCGLYGEDCLDPSKNIFNEPFVVEDPVQECLTDHYCPIVNCCFGPDCTNCDQQQIAGNCTLEGGMVCPNHFVEDKVYCCRPEAGCKWEFWVDANANAIAEPEEWQIDGCREFPDKATAEAAGFTEVCPAVTCCSKPNCEGACVPEHYTAEECEVWFNNYPCDHDWSRKGTMEGDPHIELWNQKWIDYHGGCDLVFLDAPDFANHTGLKIHVRTTTRFGYSYMSSCAVSVGNKDVFQVSSYGEYSLNGVDGASMPNTLTDNDYEIEHIQTDINQHKFTIKLGSDAMLEIKSFKDIVSVSVILDNLVKVTTDGSVRKALKTSRGLMGGFETGTMLARDGETVLENPNEFGEEWQVRPDEDGLIFRHARAPQYPAKCEYSEVKAEATHRRLEQGISEDDADKACAFLTEEGARARCRFDVIATGDLEVANAGAF